VDERAAELAETIAREGIKTIREARREVGRCATTLRLAASEARTVEAMEIDEDAMWANLAYFLDALAPVAEEAGVRLALHPDDPPVAELGGIARILRDVDALERALALADSPAVGLNLCLGTLSARGGEAVVLDAIARFGARDQIVCVHFRDVRGTVPAFEECFLGEGNYDPLEVMRALLATGFSGFMLDDHVPRLVGDTDYAHRGRAHAVGYLQALLLAAHGDPPEVAHRLDPLARGHS
ncbi:MAG: mannonate dehydratase, partial [Solirubrobacteraceae bacterium]